MPRNPRDLRPDYCYHVTVRCNNRELGCKVCFPPRTPPLSDGTFDLSYWKAKLRECKEIALNDTRFNWIKTDLMRENALRKAYPRYWTDQDFDVLKRSCALDTSLFNRKIGEHWVIQKEANFNDWDYSRRYRFWIVTKDTSRFSGLREKCFYCGKTKGQVSQLYDDLIYWEWFRYASYSTQGYHIKTVICFDCLKTTKEDMTRRFDQLYHQSPGAVKTKGLPKPSEKFLQDFRDKLAQVRQGGDAPYNLSDSDSQVDYIAVKQKYQMDNIRRRQQELAEITFKGCSDDMIEVRYDAENMRWVSSRPSRIKYPTAKEALERLRQQRSGQLELF